MKKGDSTRHVILDHAMRLAAQIGLEGLSIGRLAEDLKLSKSGLFAHFRSKEALQIQVMEEAAQRFIDVVVRPALKAPRGEARIRAIFEQWLSWPKVTHAGGCLFVALATELDDRPGPPRDHLVKLQRDWLLTLAGAAQLAITAGQFRDDLDPDQFAFELYGIMLGGHHSIRLMRDPKADIRVRLAFESLLQKVRVKKGENS